MKMNTTWILITLTSLFFLSGCVKNEIVIAPQEQRSNDNGAGNSSQGSVWGSETDEEQVDISDIESENTEERTVITEEKDHKIARIPFPAHEYKNIPSYGKGTVKGSIYLKDLYDNTVPGRGTRLYLNPVTSYSKQWYKESYLGGAKMEKADSRLFNYLRFTAADNEGNFAFYGVPSGEYYLIGTVRCGSECGFETPKNVRIATTVRVKGNEIVHKDLTKRLQ